MLEDLPSTGILKNIISLTAVKLKIVPVLNLSKPIISLLGCLELPVHLSEINIGKQVILQPIEPRLNAFSNARGKKKLVTRKQIKQQFLLTESRAVY